MTCSEGWDGKFQLDRHGGRAFFRFRGRPSAFASNLTQRRNYNMLRLLNKRRKEMLNQASADCPKHLFANILEFLPLSVRQFVETCSPSSAKSAILRCTPKDSAWCQRCGKMCVAPICDIEVAGTPCQDHSGLNLHRLNFEGCRAVFYWVWVALRRKRRETCWIHENVIGFGIKALQDDLEDLYFIVRIVVASTLLGWPSKRRRQFSVGILNALYCVLPTFSCGFQGGLTR